MGVLKQPLASPKHLKDRRGPIPSNLYHVMRKEHRSRYFSRHVQVMLWREDSYSTNVYMNLQEDGSTFNPLVSQSSDLRKRGGTNDLFGVPFDCSRT